MKKKLIVLTGLMGLAAVTAQAALINVTAATGYLQSTLSATINGAGMNTTADPSDPSTWVTSSTGWNSNWDANGSSTFTTSAPGTNSNHWAVFDLGSNQADLKAMYFWNGNDRETTRSIQEMNFYFATDTSLVAAPASGADYNFVTTAGWTLLGNSGTLNNSTGVVGESATDVFNIAAAAGARYIGWDIIDNNDTSGRTQFQEVAFSTIPEPATLGLVAMSGLGVLFVRRRLMM